MIRVAVALVALLHAGLAFADPKAADALADHASDLAAAGKFKEAAEKYAAAFREDPTRPKLFCNIGIAYFKAEEWARAHLLLSRCIDRMGSDQAFVDNARTVLRSIEDSIHAGGHVSVSVKVDPQNASVTIDEWGIDVGFVGDRQIWLPTGTYHLTAKSGGYLDRSVEVTATTGQQDVTIKLDPRPPDKPPPPQPRTRREPGPKLVPIITTSATVALVIGSLIAHRKAQSAADDANADLVKADFESDRDSMNTWNTLQGVTGIAAVVGAGVSGFLWFRAIRGREVPLEVAPSPSGASVSFKTRF